MTEGENQLGLHTKNELIIHHPSHPSNLDANLFSEVWWKKRCEEVDLFLGQRMLLGLDQPMVFFVSCRRRKKKVSRCFVFPHFFLFPVFIRNSICFYLIHPPKFCSAHPTSSVLVSHRYLQIHQTLLNKNAAKTHIDVRQHETMQQVEDVLMPIPFLYKETKGNKSKKGPGKGV